MTNEGQQLIAVQNTRKPKRQLRTVVPKPQDLEKEIPPEIKAGMGSGNWRVFKSDLSIVLREYRVAAKDLGAYLGAVETYIKKAVERVQSQKGFRGSPEDYFQVVAGVFVSAYVHGLDPYLLLAITHYETRFKPGEVSSRNAMGYMQVTRKSAVSDLDPRARDYEDRRRAFNKRVKGVFGGVELVRNERADMAKIRTHALYNAIWAGRTLVTKYSREDRLTGEPIETKRDYAGVFLWGKGNSAAIKNMLVGYQGSKASYAENVYKLYEETYRPVKSEAERAMLDAARFRRI
jgi:hypothetical protein